jgi:excisionase family DNA binding protein
MLCICSDRLEKPRKRAMNVPMQDKNTSPLGLSISQAARELGVSLGTMRRWADMGYIESYRTPGGQRRFSREHIDRFVASLSPDPRRHRSQDQDIAV